MNSKIILWLIVPIFISFCASESDSEAGQSRDETESIKRVVKRQVISSKYNRIPYRDNPNVVIWEQDRDTWVKRKRCQDYNSYCTDGTCIPQESLCNGFSDCPNGDDERNETCRNFKCSASKFRCASGACIDRKYVCDGIKHCVFDGDDETSTACSKTNIRFPLKTQSKCAANKFECSNGSCIDKKLLCNGFRDCSDGRDERKDQCQNNKCSAEKFRCSSGACIDKKYLCDGIKHCIFGADDENGAACKNQTGPKVKDAVCLLPSASSRAYQTFTVHCPNTAVCSYRAAEQVPTFTQVRVECRPGYQFRGGNTSISSCFEGTWSPTIPKCERTCALTKNPDMNLRCSEKLGGVTIPCDDAMPVGSIVQPRCKDYFHQEREVDYSFIRCQSNGQWDRQLFRCIADCGRAQGGTEGLIALGQPEQRGDSPWHVAIYDISNRKDPTLICGGTIIAPQIIVSAAHCFYDFTENTYYNSSIFEIVAAKYTLPYDVKDNRETKVYQIRKIFTPEVIIFTGDSTNYLGDIALLWTKERISFSSGVLPACVDWTNTNRYIVPDGTQGKLVGWGLTEKEEPSKVLLAAVLPYVNYKNCRTMVSPDFNVGADKFCAGTKKGAGARRGDSGGGLLFRAANTQNSLYYLRGIVSNKDSTIGENRTSLATFTDVAQYASWMFEKRIEIENQELLAETKVGLRS